MCCWENGAVVTDGCYSYIGEIYWHTRHAGADLRNHNLDYIPIRWGVLNALLKAGMDPAREYDGQHRLLHVKCGMAPNKDIRLLLDHGAAAVINVAVNGNVPLHLHIAHASTPALVTVRDLLGHGADATLRDGQGRTAIEILHARDDLKTHRSWQRKPPLDKLTKLLEDAGCPPLPAAV